MKMKYFLVIIFSSIFFSVSANEDTCRILNLKDIYIGMNYEQLSDKMDLTKLEYYIKLKEHSIDAEMFVRNSEINRLDFKLEVKEWKNDSVVLIPKEAILTYLMVTYNREEDIESELLAELGAPNKETIPEIKQIFFFDKQWICKNQAGDSVQITLTDKRVEYELLNK
jgi:hypothetical protein